MKHVRRRILVLLIAASSSTSVAWAQKDAVWRDLLRAMRFSEINRARLEFECRENPQFSSHPKLQDLCKKRPLIPDAVMETAALPYLKHHVSAQIAKEAIAALTSEPGRTLSRKSIVEIASGKHDQLTPEEIEQLGQQNRTRFSQALSAFATDREQGIAVARAMMAHEP